MDRLTRKAYFEIHRGSRLRPAKQADPANHSLGSYGTKEREEAEGTYQHLLVAWECPNLYAGRHAYLPYLPDHTLTYPYTH